MSTGERSSREYWEELWKGQRPFTYGLLRRTMKPAADRRITQVIKRYLPDGERSILEIGCAPGKWLVRFNREFGYHVYGIDYSEAGCDLTKETLRRNRIEGEVICGDAFDMSFQTRYEEFFDIVYSLGFVEHFNAPGDALDMHLRLLKRGGLLVVTIPNFGDGSVYRKWARMTGREERLVKTHNVELMKVDNFKTCLERFDNLEIRMLEYVGPIVLPIGGGYIGRLLNLLVGYLTFFLDSGTFSRHIVLVAGKR